MGTSTASGWLAAGDTEASLQAIRDLGVPVDRIDRNTLIIHGGTLQPSPKSLNLMNAGTGIRLLAGIMAGQNFESILDGSHQLRRRPMRRILIPLQQMGANIEATDGKVPIRIRPAELQGIEYEMPMASAQVKSAVLLAGLFAHGATTVVEPGSARDHTERMLRAMGASISVHDNRVTILPTDQLRPFQIEVPGDFSSAAFLLVAGAILPDSDVTIRHVNLNPTRTGLLDALLEMDAAIEVYDRGEQAGEPIGDLRVRTSDLKAVEIGGDWVVRMIDEFPILMVAALSAEGKTRVRDAQELRVKETDRIAVMASELRKLGAELTEYGDGFEIVGRQQIGGGIVDGHDDHRIAMSMTIAGLMASEQTVVQDSMCAGDSFPGFFELIEDLGGRILIETQT